MYKNQKAFTLIELMVTVTVVAVLIVVGVPNFKDLVLNNKSQALGEDFSTRLNQARYEAVKRSARVTVCASSNSTTSAPTCTGDWKDGYLVFVDQATSDTDPTASMGSTPTLIQAYAKADPKAVIDVKNDATAVTFIRFTSNGTLARIDNSTNPIVINAYLTGCKGANRNTLTVGVSGMISTKRVACPT